MRQVVCACATFVLALSGAPLMGHVDTDVTHRSVLAAVLVPPAHARGGGRHRGATRHNSRTSVNKNVNRNRNVNHNRNVNRNVNNNRNANINRNVSKNRNVNVNRSTNANVNINRNVNVNHTRHRDVDVHYHGYRSGGFAAGVAVGAATTMAIGAVVTALPAGSTSVRVNGVYYQQCGTVWYAPRYSGPNVTYVVVNAPR